MDKEIRELIISQELSGLRLDKALALLYGEMTRSHIQKLIEEEKVTVNEKCKSASYKCREGDLISIAEDAAKPVELLPQNIPLDIIYEDKDIIIVNKEKGMVVHPAPGHTEGTLVNALMYHCGAELSGINGEIRPGIVHRIDKDTTGVLVICKNDQSHTFLADLLSRHEITRVYYCIVKGCLKEESGTVNKPIGRHPYDRKKMSVNSKTPREALTHYIRLMNFKKGYSLIACRLETGRTHQIRVHMSSMGHSLLGDTVYGSEKQPFGLDGQVLHAAVLGFKHPSSGEEMTFSAKLPDEFRRTAIKLASKDELEILSQLLDKCDRGEA